MLKPLLKITVAASKAGTGTEMFDGGGCGGGGTAGLATDCSHRSVTKNCIFKITCWEFPASSLFAPLKVITCKCLRLN